MADCIRRCEQFDWAVVGVSVSVVMAAAGLMVGMIINCINRLDAEFADRIEHQDIQQFFASSGNSGRGARACSSLRALLSSARSTSSRIAHAPLLRRHNFWEL